MRLTTEQFIEKAKQIHGDKYDYSLVKYVDSLTPVKIICPIHGVFEQKPNNHIYGKSGCKKCGTEKRSLDEKEFIEKAKQIHGDKYDYSLTKYINYYTPVKIICKKHGVFEQKPRDHLDGAGCKLCIQEKSRLTTEDFIKRAKQVHGDKYDYSLVNYVNSKTKVKIICSVHGVFEQLPLDHLKGCGCRYCANKNNSSKRPKVTTEQFIKKAKLVHGDKYDYSLVNYINNRTKIKIICPVHGIFEQYANSHLQGYGCRKCSYKKRKTKRKSNKIKYKNSFIERSKQIHSNKYDYSLVDYIDNKTKVKIICPIHGIFEQTPTDHLKGGNCPKCSNLSRIQKERLSNGEFLERCKKVYGDKYDYSKTKYINIRTKVNIVCPKHGEFSQLPYIFLKGNGCPKCNSSKGENIIRKYLEKNNIVFEEQKTFPDCKYRSRLRFDFYLPKLNLIIEYDGIQHFKPIDFSNSGKNAENEFQKIKIRDQIKNDYCKENNINLLRISYKDDIIEKLKFLDQK